MNVGTRYSELNGGKVLEGELLGLRPRDSQGGGGFTNEKPCSLRSLWSFSLLS